MKGFWAEYSLATVSGYEAIRVKGIASEDFVKVDGAAGEALKRIKAILESRLAASRRSSPRLSQRSQHGSAQLQCRWRLPGCCIAHPTFS
jgi:hypothetical protein